MPVPTLAAIPVSPGDAYLPSSLELGHQQLFCPPKAQLRSRLSSAEMRCFSSLLTPGGGGAACGNNPCDTTERHPDCRFARKKQPKPLFLPCTWTIPALQCSNQLLQQICTAGVDSVGLFSVIHGLGPLERRVWLALWVVHCECSRMANDVHPMMSHVHVQPA